MYSMNKVLRRNLIIAVVCVFVSGFTASAQKSDLITLKGFVVDRDNMPVKHVKIHSKQTNFVAYSDSSGAFKVNASCGDKLIIKAKGFQRAIFEVQKKPESNMLITFNNPHPIYDGTKKSLRIYLSPQYTNSKNNSNMPLSFLNKSRNKNNPGHSDNYLISTNNNHMSQFYSNYHLQKKW